MDGNEPVIPNFGEGSRCVIDNGTFCWDWAREHWGDTLQPALLQHLWLTAIAISIGFVLAFALALLAHRVRRVEHPIGVVAALLYTIPSLALFQLLVPFTGLTKAARGMGLTRRQVLTRVELPLAVPAIIGGLRIAVVSTIAIATIAATLLPKGLGYPIFYALKLPDPFKTELYAAGTLAIALALACDAGLVLLRRTLVPWSRRRIT